MGVRATDGDAAEGDLDKLLGALNDDFEENVFEVIIVTIFVEKPAVVMLIAPLLVSYVRIGMSIVLVNSNGSELEADPDVVTVATAKIVEVVCDVRLWLQLRSPLRKGGSSTRVVGAFEVEETMLWS